jgi:hypothetical protein
MKKFLTILLSLILVLFFVVGPQSSVSAKNDDVKLKVFVHYPNPHGKPVASATCSVTTNDQVNDYLLAGWSMPSSGVTYKINYGTKPKNLSNDQVYDAVSSSFATWATADPKQIFNYGGTTSAKTAKFDGTNAILFKGISGSAIAITYVWYYPSTGQLVEVDTAFNKNLKWSYTPYTTDCGGVAGSYDLQNIGTHEFGHWVGLDDLYSDVDKDLTMYGYGDTAELKKDSLGLGDITGVNVVTP